MSRWQKGEAAIEQLAADGELQQVAGAQADGQPWIAKARRTCASAAELINPDPDSAYIFAYDAARFACVALLTHQGLRPTTTGGHYAVDVAVREQFGGHSSSSAPCVDNATNSSTHHWQLTPSRPPTPTPPSRSRRNSSTPQNACCRTWDSSDGEAASA